jgi:hypothetical protein
LLLAHSPPDVQLIVRSLQIIPRAVDYFTGKALDYETFEDDEEDFKDLDDDDDEQWDDVRYWPIFFSHSVKYSPLLR